MSRRLKAHLLLVLVTLVWGVTFVQVKDALHDISPLLFNAVRMTLAGAALALIFMAACLAQGALVAALTASEQVAQFVLALIVVPSILMTGLVFPLEAIPRWLRPVAWALPMTYFTNAMRGFTLKGATVADHAIDFLALAGFTVILSSLSLGWFRKQSA